VTLQVFEGLFVTCFQSPDNSLICPHGVPREEKPIGRALLLNGGQRGGAFVFQLLAFLAGHTSALYFVFQQPWQFGPALHFSPQFAFLHA